MKKIIFSAIIVLSSIALMPSESKAQTNSRSLSFTVEPTNALQAWSKRYQYAITHGWGEADSLYWAKVQMKIWINKHS